VEAFSTADVLVGRDRPGGVGQDHRDARVACVVWDAISLVVDVD
jgi:hypothetical protein